MHSHIHTIGPNLLNTYSARTLEKTEASQRAAEVRKKLLGTAVDIEVDADDGGNWLVGPGYQSGSQKGDGRRGYARKRDAGTEEADHLVDPISVWA